MKFLNITLWMNAGHPVRHGYTPRNEDDKAIFRLGPLVIGWEVCEE